MFSRADVLRWCKICLNAVFRRTLWKQWTAQLLVNFWTSRSQWFGCECWIMVLIFKLLLANFIVGKNFPACIQHPFCLSHLYFVASAVLFVPCWEWWKVGCESTQCYWSAHNESEEQNMRSTFQISCIESFSALCRKCGVSDTLSMRVWFVSTWVSWRSWRFCFLLLSF